MIEQRRIARAITRAVEQVVVGGGVDVVHRHRIATLAARRTARRPSPSAEA